MSKNNAFNQPPLGGCVLKLITLNTFNHFGSPAAFRRLCVETRNSPKNNAFARPAAFRRLCVETLNLLCNIKQGFQPPLGGCVLKRFRDKLVVFARPSRL